MTMNKHELAKLFNKHCVCGMMNREQFIEAVKEMRSPLFAFELGEKVRNLTIHTQAFDEKGSAVYEVRDNVGGQFVISELELLNIKGK